MEWRRVLTDSYCLHSRSSLRKSGSHLGTSFRRYSCSDGHQFALNPGFPFRIIAKLASQIIPV